MILSINRSITLLPLLIFIGLIASCIEPGSSGNDPIEPGSVQILYRGIVDEGDQSWAMFTLTNDSTEDIEYFAYSAMQPHFSTEMLSDSGWTWLFWNWCGTGASYFPLKSGSSMDFKTGLPHLDCTWRVVLSASCDPDEGGFIVSSRPIDYTLSN